MIIKVLFFFLSTISLSQVKSFKIVQEDQLKTIDSGEIIVNDNFVSPNEEYIAVLSEKQFILNNEEYKVLNYEIDKEVKGILKVNLFRNQKKYLLQLVIGKKNMMIMSDLKIHDVYKIIEIYE